MNRAVHCAAFGTRYIFEMQRVIKMDVKPSSARQRGVHCAARRAAARMVRLHAPIRVDARQIVLERRRHATPWPIVT